MKKVKRVWALKTTKIKESLSPQQKAVIEKRCEEFVISTFKPKVLKQFNLYKNEKNLINIYCKWHREFFYFIAVINDNGLDVITSEYEDKIARLEPKTDTTFYLSYLRYTGEWFDITHGQGLSLLTCLKNIATLTHFYPI